MPFLVDLVGAPWWLTLFVLGVGVAAVYSSWEATVEATRKLVGPSAGWPSFENVYHRTDRLVIRQLTYQDRAAFNRSLDDEVVNKNGWLPEHALQQKKIVGGKSDIGRIGQFCGCLPDTNEAIVFISLAYVEATDSSAGGWNVGVWTTSGQRGKGYTSEALAGAFEVFHEGGLETVHLGTAIDNESMRNTILAAGGVEQERRPHPLPNGNVVPSVWYSHGSGTSGHNDVHDPDKLLPSNAVTGSNDEAAVGPVPSIDADELPGEDQFGPNRVLGLTVLAAIALLMVGLVTELIRGGANDLPAIPDGDWPAGHLAAFGESIAVVACGANGTASVAVVNVDGSAGAEVQVDNVASSPWVRQSWWNGGDGGAAAFGLWGDEWRTKSPRTDVVRFELSGLRRAESVLALFDLETRTIDPLNSDVRSPWIVRRESNDGDQVVLEGRVASWPHFDGDDPQTVGIRRYLSHPGYSPYLFEATYSDNGSELERLRWSTSAENSRRRYQEVQFVSAGDVSADGRLLLPDCPDGRLDSSDTVDLASVGRPWLGSADWSPTLEPLVKISLDPNGRPYETFVAPLDAFVRTTVATLAIPGGKMLVMDGNAVEVSPRAFADEAVLIEVEPDRVRADGTHEVNVDAVSSSGSGQLGIWLGPSDAKVVSWDPLEHAYVTDGGIGGVIAESVVLSPVSRNDDELWIESPSYESVEVYDRDGVEGPETLIFQNGYGDGGFPLSRGRNADGEVVAVVIWRIDFPWRLAFPGATPPAQITTLEDQMQECIDGQRPIDDSGSCLQEFD